jgi:hypothetical protein
VAAETPLKRNPRRAKKPGVRRNLACVGSKLPTAVNAWENHYPFPVDKGRRTVRRKSNNRCTGIPQLSRCTKQLNLAYLLVCSHIKAASASILRGGGHPPCEGDMKVKYLILIVVLGGAVHSFSASAACLGNTLDDCLKEVRSATKNVVTEPTAEHVRDAAKVTRECINCATENISDHLRNLRPNSSGDGEVKD